MRLQLSTAPVLLLLLLCFRWTSTEHQHIPKVASNSRENVMPDNNKEGIKMLTTEAKENFDTDLTDIYAEDTYHGKTGNDVSEQSETNYFGDERSPNYKTIVTILVELNKKVLDQNKKFKDLENEWQKKFHDQASKNQDLKDKVHKLEEEVEALSYQKQTDGTGLGENLKSTTDRRVKKDADWYHRRQAARGGVYIRWGRDDCPATARKIYDGAVAGSYWNHTGGGSDYLCLPKTPIYDTTTSDLDTWRARLYGVEYEIHNFSPLASLNENDAPCAVCQAMSRSNVLMVPARNDCPGGWTREYYGYLMSDHVGHKRTEFICVDHNPKVRLGTAGENTGGNLCLTEGYCSSSGGGIPCGPYEKGKEITCSVCTK